jgi:hypothetical protein
MRILHCALLIALLSVTATVSGAEKAWQKGTWRDAKIERQKVVFGVAPNNPNSGIPRTSPPAAMERRSYVIETDALRLDIRLDATVDTPRIDVVIGQPVTFAMEKNDIWIKDDEGHEHRMKISKKTVKVSEGRRE